MTTTQNATQEIETHIGTLEFTHDFANGFPTDATAEKLYDERDFQRACQAYSGRCRLRSCRCRRAAPAAGSPTPGKTAFQTPKRQHDISCSGPHRKFRMMSRGYAVRHSPT
jgi:hypothetical protein